MAAVTLATGAPWPADRGEAGRLAMTGVLIHGVTFMGLFSALARGLPSGVIALVMGLQPLLTALAAGPLLGERMKARQWFGMVAGFAGVAVVITDKLDFGGADLAGIALAGVAVTGFTAGTLYQKRHGATMRLRSGHTIQFAAAALLTGAFSLAFETGVIRWTGEFVFGLAWLVVVLSLGAVSLLYVMLRHGQASKVVSLFYLVPPVTALIGFVLFDETLGALALAGMAVSVFGVALVTRQ
jgi:drug/metabolite transporter (DMT)-like permease